MKSNPLTFIWATRGRDWGTRFLKDGGLEDPLRRYEKAFAGQQAARAVERVVGSDTAIRFLDPAAREDRSGRPITHSFVVIDAVPAGPGEMNRLRSQLWDQVADEYIRIWDLPEGFEQRSGSA